MAKHVYLEDKMIGSIPIVVTTQLHHYFQARQLRRIDFKRFQIHWRYHIIFHTTILRLHIGWTEYNFR